VRTNLEPALLGLIKKPSLASGPWVTDFRICHYAL